MGYTKLDEGILLSSIMACDPKTFKVWIALLAACKPDGIAPVSSVGISSVCRLSLDETKAAIEELSSPDTESRSIQNEGKRIERVDGGYRIINYQKFRELNYKEADAKRKYEERKKKTCPEMSGDMADINASASASASCIKEGMQGGNDFSTLFLEFWSSYPRKEGKGAAYKSWMKISSPGETLQLILIALEWQKQTEQRNRYLVDSIGVIVDRDSILELSAATVFYKKQLTCKKYQLDTRLECLEFLLTNKLRTKAQATAYLVVLKRYCDGRQAMYYAARRTVPDNQKHLAVAYMRKAQDDCGRVQVMIERLEK